ncbi:hypothetical protein [Microbacterium sp. VKM Ac-2923]|uniref:hypothetical protein n=1 Tax=Microbacterium sp. VKM Ac-2923 TaxID=2929476 RepID=UPI001FB432EF|nr:hypothetical protein [Microbacterium sp. VKM Ac-2923]MCJ1709236.1 hypothetical protein [Microbacterium sp. VKM Ac-2923]
MDERRAGLLVDTVAARRTSLAEALLRVLLGLWLPFRWANNPDLINAAAARSAVDVDIALAQARRLARAFEIEQLRALDALPTTLPPIEDLYPRSGTAIVEVYKRPARQYEHAIREGKTPEQAESILVERLERIVEADVAATMRDEKDRVRAAAPKVIGYRRVLRPERTKSGPCGLCVVAADRIYRTGDLLELHNGCVCETVDVTEDSDPGRSLNREDLDLIYAAAGSQFAEDLQRTRVTVRENGELGPILVRDGDSFKEWDRANAQNKRGGSGKTYSPYQKPTVDDDWRNWVDQRAISERAIKRFEDAKRSGSNVIDYDAAIAHHRSLITRAQAHGA